MSLEPYKYSKFLGFLNFCCLAADPKYHFFHSEQKRWSFETFEIPTFPAKFFEDLVLIFKNCSGPSSQKSKAIASGSAAFSQGLLQLCAKEFRSKFFCSIVSKNLRLNQKFAEYFIRQI